MDTRGEVPKLVVEFIGTFTLTFAGIGAIVGTQGQDLVAIALAHGLAIFLMVAAAGHISGGVYNPAVAIGLMAAGKLPIPRGAGFIVAELLGAVVAAGLLKVILPAEAVDAVSLGTPLPGAGIGAGQALLMEMVLTFFLVFVIFGVAVDDRGPKALVGLPIGLTVAMDILAGGPISGAAMNPARSFGPALVQSAWRDNWVYWVGPILGALAAALLYTFVLLDRFQEQDESINLPQSDRSDRSVDPRGR